MNLQKDLSKTSLPATVMAHLNDENPQPMRNSKPAVKNPNAADQFLSDHIDEHEKRAATPAIVNVQEYNEVPVLKETLDKKRDLVKIRASATAVAKPNSDNQEHHDKLFHHCNKPWLMEKQKRRPIPHRSQERSKRPELRSRVTKSNCRQGTIPNSRYSLADRRKKCRCRHCLRVTNRGTCTNLVLKEASTLTCFVLENKDPKRVPADTDCSNTPAGSAKSDYTDSRNSVHSSIPSGSFISNISHMSLDHEPMVTNEN